MSITERFTSWPLIVSGIVLIVVGLVCLFMPGVALATVALIVGIGFFVSAASCFIGIYLEAGVSAGALALNGILDLVIGLIICFNPVVAGVFALWFLFGALLIFGIANLVMGWREHRLGSGSGASRICAAIATIILAILVIAMPGLLPMFIGLIALVRGVMLIILAFSASRAIESL